MAAIQTLIKSGRYREAIDFYECKASLDKVQGTDTQELAKIFSNISYIYYLMKDYSQAQKKAEVALALNPNWYKIYYRLAKIYEAIGDYEKMCKEYNTMSILADAAGESDPSTQHMQDYYNRDVNFLRSWIILNGGEVDNQLKIEYYDVDYRGMIVANKIKSKTPLIKVPFACILSLEDSKQKNPYNKILLEKNTRINSVHTYLAIEVLYVRSNSLFQMPYIRCLPKYFDNVPINFKIDELQMLRGSYAIVKMIQKIILLCMEYENIIAVIPDFPYTLAEFSWARTSIITRVYAVIRNGIQDTVLVPFADMANHKTPPNTKWSFNEDIQQFVVESEDTFYTGDVLYETYGHKCNYRYFVNYGFTVPNNDDEEVSICFNPLLRRLIETYVTDILDGKGIVSDIPKAELPNMVLFAVLDKYYRYNTQDNHSIATTILSERDVFQVGYGYNDVVIKMFNFLRGGFEISDKATEIKVHVAIMSVATQILSGFITSLEDDQIMLNQYDYSFNRRNAIVMRIGEKKVLCFWISLSSACLELLRSADIKRIKKFNKKINKFNLYAPFKTFALYIQAIAQL